MTEVNPALPGDLLAPFMTLGRAGLLPALHAAQKHYGWLPPEAAAEVARALNVPLADVHGVIEFYSLFYNKPVGKKIARICTDAACALKGADDTLNELCARHGIHPGQTTPDGALTFESSPCLGLCDHAPAQLWVDGSQYFIFTGEEQSTHPRSLVYGTSPLLTSNCGRGWATTLAEYGGYQALEKARRMSPAGVIDEIKTSGLVGRGGAAFPTGIKWEGAANAPGNEKYVVCNADESEPGTFKDRALLLDDPHRTIEGMCIAAYAIGANRGYIYLRGEYPYILPALETALAEARAAGYLGAGFDIEIRLGAGAYICGEETALFESIEGKRGFPRIKPPFPTTHGLFNQPTVINNVETLCNVPLILGMGAARYREIGTEKSPGPKLFCVSGDVAQPGVYEVPFGVTLRELLEMAGGVTDSSTDSEPDKRMETDVSADKRMEADSSADFEPDKRMEADSSADFESDKRMETDVSADKRMEADSSADFEPDKRMETDVSADKRMEADAGLESGETGQPANKTARLQAVLFGGAAGAFATPAQLDVRLTFEDLRAAGLPLGSGVVMVFNHSRDLRQTLARLGRFFAHESCGKCYPCQMGTQRQMEILDRLESGTWKAGDLERLRDVGWTMTDASLCGLGQTAASVVLSAMRTFPALFPQK